MKFPTADTPRKKTATILLVLAITAVITAPAVAAVYYVDSNQGDDSNSGLSEQQAWKSLEQVNEAVFSPGDRILFRAGSRYTGQLKPQGSGSPENPIQVDQYGEGGLPRIDGLGQVQSTVLLKDVEGWEIRNLEITNKGDELGRGRRGVHIVNETLQTARHFVLERLYVHDVNGAIEKSRHSGIAILAEVSERRTHRFDGLVIENCYIRDCSRDAIRIWGVYDRHRWSPSLNVVIRNNLIEGVGGDGIVPVGCDGVLVEYNTMRNCPRLPAAGGAAAGIWPWGCDNTVIQYNEVSDHKAWVDAQGFDSDYNCNNTIIQYNYSHDNEGGFLLICCPGNEKHGSLSRTERRNTGTIIRHNISINDGYKETEGGRPYFSPTFHITGPVENTKIYNNIIVVPKKANARIDRSIVGMDNWGGSWPVDTLFSNNVFMVAGTADFEFGKDRGTAFTGNLYFGKFDALPEDAAARVVDPGFKPKGDLKGFDMFNGFMSGTGRPAGVGADISRGPIPDPSGIPDSISVPPQP
jgi:hypothetical protein